MKLFKNKKLILDENKETVKKGTTPKEEKDVKRETDLFFKEIKSFERDRIAQIKNFSKIGWAIAAAASIVSVAMAVAISSMMPLKTVTPFVIRVDNNTGFTDIAEPLSDTKTTQGKEVDKYFLAKWVVDRESYEWQTVQNTYDALQLTSDNNTFSEYKNIIEDKKTSPLYILKQEKKIATRVTSVTFISDDPAHILAQVRFIKYIKNANGSLAVEYPTTNWIGTISYDYQKKINKAQERLINPLGFQVTSYRVVPESVGGKR